MTGSDCEVIIPMMQQVILFTSGIFHFSLTMTMSLILQIPQYGYINAPSKLKGMFSFMLFDKNDESYCAVRDHIGITPLYIGHGADGSTWFSSELKAMSGKDVSVKVFPPGHIYSSKTKTFVKWYKPNWAENIIPKVPYNKEKLRLAFESAVERRMMSDVPWVRSYIICI